MANLKSAPPLVVHLVYRFDFGGLETLVAECINRMPPERYRHAVVCLSDYNPEFARAITRPGVQILALHKPPGLGLGIHLRFWKLMLRLRPRVLHTYNLAAAEFAFSAALARVPVRVHAEHGRDAADPQGLNRRHNLLRRLLLPFIHCYVPVSADLRHWLRERVGIPDAKNLLIHNGVDTARFQPAGGAALPADWPFAPQDMVLGTVGRIQDIKNHAGLVEAFQLLRQRLPQQAARLKLAIAGDGPLLPALRAQVRQAGLEEAVWLPGARSDIPSLMAGFSVFALASIAEGTPVTILEAMACGLPVVATRVGGIPEVVEEGRTGALVPAGDSHALAEALARYCEQPELRTRHGAAGRDRVEQRNSIGAMVTAYADLYDAIRKDKVNFREAIKPCAE